MNPAKTVSVDGDSQIHLNEDFSEHILRPHGLADVNHSYKQNFAQKTKTCEAANLWKSKVFLLSHVLPRLKVTSNSLFF